MVAVWFGGSGAFAQDYAVWSVGSGPSDALQFSPLPDERARGSISIGDVSDGYLAHSVRITEPSPTTAFLPVQFKRGIAHTTDELAQLVESASVYVAQRYPESVVYLGNFSARYGGDIPYSVSHNSGRDCDVAFFMKDEAGQPWVPPDLAPLDENGVWQPDEEGPAYHFDTGRNWALVEGFLAGDQGRLQFIFVSTGLKKLLLDYARSVNADPAVIAAADEILQQPGGALPHNDHFHLRVFCSDDDIWGGCVDQGRTTTRHRPDGSQRVVARAWAAEFLQHEDAQVRVASLRRLALLGARDYEKPVASRLDDDVPEVRVAAARALSALGRGGKFLASRLKVEQNANARLEMVAALADIGGVVAVGTLVDVLEAPTTAEIVPGLVVDERALAADALARLEDGRAVKALIASLSVTDLALQSRVLVALQKLTNNDLGVDQAAWTQWFKKEGRKKRDAWLVAGFEAAGFAVKRLSAKFVWDLCRAIDGPDWVSFNAQRALMRIAGREVPSLEWSRADASFYWRRWFERRATKYRLPPIPADMSTLTPAQSVSSR